MKNWKTNTIILSIAVLLGCGSLKHFPPFRTKILFSGEISKDTFVSMEYIYRYNLGLHGVFISVKANNKRWNYELSYSSEIIGDTVRPLHSITRVVKEETIIECDEHLNMNSKVKIFPTMATDTSDFSNPMFFNNRINKGYDTLYKYAQRSDFCFYSITNFEKGIFTELNKRISKRALILERVDASRLLGWLKYVGDCKKGLN